MTEAEVSRVGERRHFADGLKGGRRSRESRNAATDARKANK